MLEIKIVDLVKYNLRNVILCSMSSLNSAQYNLALM
jgi:hypothetical protein